MTELPQSFSDENDSSLTLARVGSMPSTRELGAIETMDDALALLTAYGLTELAFAEELGDGFRPYPGGKEGLIGRAIFILSIRRSISDEHRDEITGEFVPFSIVRFLVPGATRRDPAGKYFISDGSTGIHRELTDFLVNSRGDTEETGTGMIGMWAPNGLRLSEYTTVYNGRSVSGKTFYIDTVPLAPQA